MTTATKVKKKKQPRSLAELDCILDVSFVIDQCEYNLNWYRVNIARYDERDDPQSIGHIAAFEVPFTSKSVDFTRLDEESADACVLAEDLIVHGAGTPEFFSYGSVLYVDTVTINTAHRGLGIGPAALQAFLDRMGAIYEHALLMPEPLPDDDLAETDPVAKAKIIASWESIGFEKITPLVWCRTISD